MTTSKTRGLINRKQCGTTLDNKLAEQLDELSKHTRIAKSRLLDEALVLLFKQHNALK